MVSAKITALLLAREFDPVTPPSFGQQVAGTLEDAFYIEFPGLGHYVFADSACARHIVAEFVGAPDTMPGSDCASSKEINFVLR